VAHGRHKRDTDARPSLLRRTRLPLLAAPVALVATGGAVALGVAANGSSSVIAADSAQSISHAVPTPSASSSAATPSTAPKPKPKATASAKAKPKPRRAAVASRSQTRTKMYAEVDLNLWTAAGDAAQNVGLLSAGDPATYTGVTEQGRQQVVVDGGTRWVTSGHLSSDKPDPDPANAPLSDAPCPDTSVENGLKPETVRVYRAVCHAFPEVKDYGGLAPRTEHDTGNAIDVMVYGDKALGDRIADWVQAHAADFDLYDLIWYDRIWTPVRSAEGWRDYGDHGSPTANHMDHVHIGTN
jgi:hypothetical protein